MVKVGKNGVNFHRGPVPAPGTSKGMASTGESAAWCIGVTLSIGVLSLVIGFVRFLRSLLLCLQSLVTVILPGMKTELPVLCTSILTETDISSLINRGLVAEVVSYLPRSLPSDESVGFVCQALVHIGEKGRAELLQVLQSLNGTEGLVDFWKCLVHDEVHQHESGAWGRRDILAFSKATAFMELVNTHLRNDLRQGDLTFTNAVINSGYARALAICMKNAECSWESRLWAVITLGNLCCFCNLPDYQKEVIAEMDILPQAIDFLKSGNCFAVTGSSAIIARLIQNNGNRRDLVLEHGAVKQLVRILKEPTNLEHQNLNLLKNCLKSVEYILGTEPRVFLEAVRTVPSALANCFSSEDLDVLYLAMECVNQFLGYQARGVAIILRNFGLVQKMTRLHKYAGCPALEQKSAELVLLTYQLGTGSQRHSLLEQLLPNYFEIYLQAFTSEARRATLELLMCILNEELSAPQKRILRELDPLVLREIHRNIPATSDLALYVHQRLV